MQTVQQWTAAPHDGEVWLSGMDVMRTVLRHDLKKSAFRKCRHDRSGRIEVFREAIESYRMDRDGYDRVVEEAFSRPRNRTRYVHDEEGDDFDAERYAEEKGTPGMRCMETPYFVPTRHKPALSIHIEAAIPHDMRKRAEMERRQREAYQVALQAEHEGRPCRVIASARVKVPELANPVTWCIVVKDFHEPIFPTIWGALQTSETANSLLSLMSQCIIGTVDRENGHVMSYTVSVDDAEEAVIVAQTSNVFLRGIAE